MLSWQLSNTLDVGFCLRTLAHALHVAPASHILNSDQGSQFTSLAYEQALLVVGCRISRDGRGRAADSAFLERIWRTSNGSTSTSTPPPTATTCTSNCLRILPITITIDPTKVCAAKHLLKFLLNLYLCKHKYIT